MGRHDRRGVDRRASFRLRLYVFVFVAFVVWLAWFSSTHQHSAPNNPRPSPTAAAR